VNKLLQSEDNKCCTHAVCSASNDFAACFYSFIITVGNRLCLKQVAAFVSFIVF